MKQAHIFVSGFVQGVGYRWFVKKNGRKLGIKGWVRNLPDRRVEALLQGNEEALKQLIKRCNKGPFLSEVKDLAVEWEISELEYEDLKILK